MDLRRVLQKFDVNEFCKRHGGRKESPSPHTFEWLFPCVSCGSSRLRYNHKKQTWICWGCNDTGGLLKLIQGLERCADLRALEIVFAGYVGGDSPIQGLDLDLVSMYAKPAVRYLPSMHWPKTADRLTAAVMAPHMRAWQYLTWAPPHGRGITVEQVEQYQLGVGRSGRLDNYVVFPCFMDRGLVYYQGRAMWDPPPELEGVARRDWVESTGYRKTLNPISKADDSQAHGHEVMFNYDRAAAHEWIIITEGPVDAIKAGDNAVALIGKDPNPVKLERIARLPARTYVVYLDYGADESAEHIAKELHQYGDVLIATPPPGKDPGDLTRDENAACIQQAARYQPGALNLKLA